MIIHVMILIIIINIIICFSIAHEYPSLIVISISFQFFLMKELVRCNQSEVQPFSRGASRVAVPLTPMPAAVAPTLLGRDFQKIEPGTPLLVLIDSPHDVFLSLPQPPAQTTKRSHGKDTGERYPVFINESSYYPTVAILCTREILTVF